MSSLFFKTWCNLFIGWQSTYPFWVGNDISHYYKKGISHRLETHTKRFSQGLNYHFRNCLYGKYLVMGTFRDRYPSWKVGYRDGSSQNSHEKPLFARVFTVTLAKSSVRFLNYMLIFTIFSRDSESRDFNYENPL